MPNPSLPIAIVEDNSPIRKLFSTLLKKSGFEILEFENGETALKGLKENDVSTIILDILLPDVNGSDIIEDIRQIPKCKDIPIVAVTGFAQATDKEKYLKLGFDAYIAKPINTKTFSEEINEIRNEKFGREN